MASVTIPDGLTGKDLFGFLVSNKAALIAQKKSATKYSDGLHVPYFLDKTGQTVKAAPIQPEADGSIRRVCVINTTNWMDSMSDVHMPGIWDKSIKESTNDYLVQEHQFNFNGIITGNVKVSAKMLSWAAIGFNSPGETQALLYDSLISPNRNPKMYEAYLNGWVPNHSVAMQYVRLSLCVNDDDYKEEYANWQNYIGSVANAPEADQQGYFWAIKEAKKIEGSACVTGVNIRTPVLDDSTSATPLKSTLYAPQDDFNVLDLISKHQFIN